jgi:hypothetical protein
MWGRISSCGRFLIGPSFVCTATGGLEIRRRLGEVAEKRCGAGFHPAADFQSALLSFASEQAD